MKKLPVFALFAALALSTAGFAQTAPKSKKVAPKADKMHSDKMHNDKMSDGKMSNGKMSDGKMSDGKMKADKMKHQR